MKLHRLESFGAATSQKESAIVLIEATVASVFATGLDHPEGLAFASDGVLYAGGEAGQVYRISPDDQAVSEVANVGGVCLGMAFDREDDLFICNRGLAAIVRVTRAGGVSLFADSAGGRGLITPNFPVFDHEGNLYVSDSGTWQGNDGVVYRFRPDGRGEVFAAPFNFSNGIALDADESHLYVVESNSHRVTRIAIKRDGTAGERDVFASDIQRVPDGLAFDEAGRLYVGCWAVERVYVVDRDGRVSILLEDPDAFALNRPTNCAFGGSNFDELYIANFGWHHIARVSLGRKGQRLYGGPQ